MTAPSPYQGLGVFSPKVNSFSIARKQISQNGAGVLGLRIVGTDGTLVDATGVAVIIYLDPDFDETNAFPDENPLGTELADYTGTQVVREGQGVYSVQIGQDISKDRGNLTAVWSYTVEGHSFLYTDYLQVIEHMPHYDLLREDEKDIVEQVTWMFADLFDSTNGGPNLTENFQTHFGYERIAQLMKFAMIRINTQGVPLMNFGVGEGDTRLPDQFTGLMVMATYLEVMLHFVRSYVEQPDFKGMAVTYTDRRDYYQRWKQLYDDEKRNFDKQLIYAKRKFLSLGSGSLLVAGGIFGGAGRYFRSGTYSAQLRSQRFYPYASAVFIR